MSIARHHRPPFSTRHAFALAFDLAVRRDPIHSLLVPLVLRSPWVIALFVLPPLEQTNRPGHVLLLASAALLGLFLTWIGVDAMIRVRARSVFNTAPDVHPAPVMECYARGIRRLPWLYVTEFVRNIVLAFAFSFFIVPGVVLGYRLGFATEAVVLDDHDLARAFQHSFHLSRGRFERWVEMICISVAMVLGALFLATALAVFVGRLAWPTWVMLGSLLAVGVLPIIQYAWTFFYLRLVEVEEPEIADAATLSGTSGPVAGAGQSEPARPA